VDVPPGPIVAGGRLLDTVAVRDLHGSLDDIARQIQVRAEDLVTALAELTEVGWVALEPRDGGHVMLRLADDAR
jgi:DNA-binding IclR family transcriptional regulator